MLGLSGIAAYLPMALFSPLAGIAADRFSRKFICIFSDMAMGLTAMVYALCLFWFDLPVWTIFIMLCARGIGSTFQQPAIQSVIPQLVPSGQLVKTNGWMQLMNAGSFLLGPVIGAALYAAFPMSVVLMSDVIGAVLASAALAAVRIPRLQPGQQHRQTMAVQFKEGLSVFRQDSRLLCLVTAEALCMFFYGPLSSFYPLMTSDYFSLSAVHGSLVELAFAAGMILSSLLFSSVLTVSRKIRVSYLGTVRHGSHLGSLRSPSAHLLGVDPVRGAVRGTRRLRQYTHHSADCLYPGDRGAEKMGRAFSVLTLISSFTMPAGLLLSSPVAEKVGVQYGSSSPAPPL